MQGGDRQDVARLRRGIGAHFSEVEREQGADVGVADFAFVESPCLIASHGKRWLSRALGCVDADAKY
jgi:hypothetical protein